MKSSSFVVAASLYYCISLWGVKSAFLVLILCLAMDICFDTIQKILDESD